MKRKPKIRKPISEEKIRAIVDKMPGGIMGFCKGWGWLTFARKLEKLHGITGGMK